MGWTAQSTPRPPPNPRKDDELEARGWPRESRAAGQGDPWTAAAEEGKDPQQRSRSGTPELRSKASEEQRGKAGQPCGRAGAGQFWDTRGSDPEKNAEKSN